jgi:hypothetical protein
MAPHYRRTTVLLLAALASQPVDAADLNGKTVAAFDRYVRATEERLDSPDAPFLWVDTLPAEDRKTRTASLRQGGLIIEPLTTRERGGEIEIPDGIVHHWLGVVFAPGVSLNSAVALLQDYNRHEVVYRPNIAASKLITRDGDRFKVALRFSMKKVITVVVNSEHDAQFTRHSPTRVSSRIHSTRIAEVENPGTPSERELPVGRDGGYLWRLNSYWRFEERDGGVYIQCESISLTRGIPYGLGWAVRPFVTSIPRETLAFTLETTRKALVAPDATSPRSSR